MKNWSRESIDLESHIVRYRIKVDNCIISIKQWVELLKTSPEFILFFNEILADSRFKAFFFETRPVSVNTLENIFEFVLVESTSLENLNPNPSRFKEFFTNEHAVSFPNLGRDAILVVPTPKIEHHTYSHIANFVRSAPEEQILSLWQEVATQYEGKINESPIWLSTAGMGVYWLHVRICNSPKYYRYKPYKKIDE